MKKNLTLLLLCCAYVLSAQTFVPTTTMMPWSSTWKWKNNSSDLGTAWYAAGYNDAAFSSGPAPLGYGAIDAGYFGLVIPAQPVATSIGSQGATGGTNTATFYFRSTFSVSASSYSVVQFKLRVDDGCAIYINGQMVSTAMTKYATASSTSSTVSTSTVSLPFQLTAPWTYTSMTNAQSTDGQDLFTFTVSATSTLLVNGTNTIAVEAHNRSNDSSDMLWAMQIEGGDISATTPTTSSAPVIVKGPYLQIGTQSSMMIRWESDIATDTKVMYGTSAASLTSVLTNTASVTQHSVTITGLAPYTKYYYSIGTSTLVMQGDANNYFVTSPVPGTAGKYRFWMVGDCGNASTNQVNCLNQYIAYTGTTVTNGMLLSGDNAYNSGTNAEYNSEFFGIYQGSALKKMPMWSAPGNHDYNNGASTATTVPYFTYFTTPTNGEAGGVPSNNPAYYSFDYGNIHFLSLDSYGTTGASQKMYDTTGAQTLWLKQDLAANTKKWTIAYWHHPPYTMGSHNSDSESDLVAIRQKFIRILERNKVDMIICGHSHDYERSRLMNGHYGAEATYSAAVHDLSSSSGKYDGSSNSCPYTKDSTLNRTGTVYVLSGSAGQLGGQQGSFPHDAMYYSNATNGGTFILDIEDNKLEGKWLCADGVIRDNFTIFKDVKSKKTYTVQPGQATTLSASWPGSYAWSNGATTRSITATVLADSTIWVRDPNSCVADTFRLKALPSASFSTSGTALCEGTPLTLNDLSSNSAMAWSWSVTPSAGVSLNSTTVKNPTVTFSSAGTYTVDLVSANINGAGALFSRTITINANPVVSVAGSATAICTGQSAGINGTVTGAASYSWSNGAGSSSILVSPATATVYTLTAISAAGCQAYATQAIAVNALPSLSITASPLSAAVCNGQTLSLSGSGASAYAWSNGIINASAFTATANATYTLTGTDANGCQNTAIQSVTVNAAPVLSITTNPSGASACSGSTVSLAAAGASTLSWSSGIINGSAFTLTSTAVYTVTGTDNNGCQSTATQSVTALALPVLTISSIPAGASVCYGSALSLNASGASTVAWSNGIPNNSAYTATASGIYTVTGINANGCQSTATKSITVMALPVLTVSSSPASAAICSGATISLNAGGASTVSWSGGLTNNSAFTPSATTVYTVTGTDNNGCQNSATKTIMVNALPLLTITASNSLCAGQTATLSASGASSYVWNTAATSSVITVTPAVTTSYTLTGTGANGCTASSVTTITVYALPAVSVMANPISAIVCAGHALTLNGSGASSYSWSGGIANGVSFVPATSATYTLTGTDSHGCQKMAVQAVVVNPLPAVTVLGSSAVCAGETATAVASGAASYNWSNGATGALFSSQLNSPATFTVTGSDFNGCSNSAIMSILVNSVPPVNAISSGSLICAGESATLTASGAASYHWSTNSASSSIVVSPVQNTSYTVTGTDANGCANRAVIAEQVSDCTSLVSLAESGDGASLFPNQNSGTFTIELNRIGDFSLAIYNTVDEIVYSGKLHTGSNSLSLSLKNGIYFYSIGNMKGIISSGKLVID